MDQISLWAYAKLNLTLDVVGRRSDGYHLLQSVMQSISLADLITLRPQSREITLVTDHPTLPTDERNICWRAVTAFRSHTGVTKGVEIEIAKEIPLQAGLGGGSTDAAAVLHGLNRLFATNLSLTELQTIGLQLGADVPFCLQGGTALVQGIGEQVTPLDPFPETFIVLVKPQQGVSTAQVYQNLAPEAHGGNSTKELVAHLEAQAPVELLGSRLANALEAVTIKLVPEVGVWKGRLLGAGAVGALMSGSGTTVFGIFNSAELAHQFVADWADQATVFVVHPMPRGVDERNGGYVR